MLKCQYCGLIGESGDGDLQLDLYHRGFWCELCDGYTYLNETSDKHRFTLILEEKQGKNQLPKVSHPLLKKQLSPLRYPGGKSKLIDYLYSFLQSHQTETLISPYSGGGSFELAMLDAGIIKNLHLNDLDTGVYALWWIIVHSPYSIIDRIKNVIPTHEDYYRAQSVIKNDYIGVDMVDAAWSLLLVNRLAYSGIVKSGPLGGKRGNQHQMLSRWNPETLVKRIKHIHSFADYIHVSQKNALELIEEAYFNDNTTIFIDPPYVNKGESLYHCYHTEDDHIKLSVLLDSLHHGLPGADIIVTYDYNDWLEQLYNLPNVEIIGRHYSA